MQIPAAAYVLAGGQSRRLGRPKWEAKINAGTLLDRSTGLCRSLFEEWYVVAKKGMVTAPPAAVSDAVGIHSPLAGIAAALGHSRRDWNFVLSCDMPLMTAEVIMKLWRHTRENPEIVVPRTGEQLQPLCAFYSASLLTRCEGMLAKEEYALTRLIGSSTVRVVDFSREEEPFFNVNTPEDLERVRRQLVRGYRSS